MDDLKNDEELAEEGRSFAEDGELYEHYRIEADRGQGLLRIDKFLMTRIERATRTKIQQAAQAGNILVNGHTTKSSYRVRPFDVITIILPDPPRELEIIPQEIPLDIVYEDQWLMVVNKPAGLVVHPGFGNYDGTLLNALTWYIMHTTGVSAAEAVPHLVHRIDKNTSGLLLVARDEVTQSRLAKQFAEHTIDRVYHALVWGMPEPESGTITGHIGRGRKDRKVMEVYPDGSVGKHAITHYRTLERFQYVSLIECRLETGRTHQIRAHMKYAGHPLFNDETYGGNRVLRGTTFTRYRQFVENCFDIMPRQALHARTLGFYHPYKEERIHFHSLPTADFEAVVERWRQYTTNGKL